MMTPRCKMVVQLELIKLGLHCKLVELGRAETIEAVSAEQLSKFRIALLKCGLELMDNKKNILVEKIKNVIIEMVYYYDYQLKTNFSDYLSEKLDLDYTYLANIFSEEQGVTIEHFVIVNKVQRIKELIEYNDLNLTEISWKMNYSSVAHLSTQFKKITGVTPSHFRYLGAQSRMAVVNV